MEAEYIEKLKEETDKINAYIDWANGGEEEFYLRMVNLTFELIQKERSKRESLVEALEDLIDLTKGVDEDGDVYNAQQIDYDDIEKILERHNIKL
jgi:hypothetical protein